MRELQKGLWWWKARHPEWTAEDDTAGRDWGPEVSSYAIDDDQRLLLLDTTTPPSPVAELASERETVIAPRASSLRSPPPDTGRILVQNSGPR